MGPLRCERVKQKDRLAAVFPKSPINKAATVSKFSAANAPAAATAAAAAAEGGTAAAEAARRNTVIGARCDGTGAARKTAAAAAPLPRVATAAAGRVARKWSARDCVGTAATA